MSKIISTIKKRIRVRGKWLILLAAIAFAQKEMSLLGIGVAVGGLSIRLWASGHINKDAELTVSGPYAYSRNPLYLGSLVLGTGICIALRNYYLLATVLVLFALVYRPTVLAEENKLLGRYKEEYMAYLDAVPRLIPRLTRAYPVAKKFSWDIVRQNREYKTVLGAISALCIFDLMEDIIFPSLLSKISIAVLLKQHYPWILVVFPF